jgi:hypothetical protein
MGSLLSTETVEINDGNVKMHLFAPLVFDEHRWCSGLGIFIPEVQEPGAFE